MSKREKRKKSGIEGIAVVSRDLIITKLANKFIEGVLACLLNDQGKALHFRAALLSLLSHK